MGVLCSFGSMGGACSPCCRLGGYMVFFRIPIDGVAGMCGVRNDACSCVIPENEAETGKRNEGLSLWLQIHQNTAKSLFITGLRRNPLYITGCPMLRTIMGQAVPRVVLPIIMEVEADRILIRLSVRSHQLVFCASSLSVGLRYLCFSLSVW